MSDSLELREVRILAGGASLIEVDCLINAGDVVTIMGPSGVGKSTLLAFVTGSLAPGFVGQGRVVLGGDDITDTPPHERHIGILFQDDLLFPHMSVGQNLAFGLAKGGTRAERRRKIESELAKIGLAGFHDRDPATLSGGQASRVQLLRMLLSEPRALLLDEAFSSLDAGLRAQVRDMVFDRARALGLPVLMVTHDAEDARAAGGRIIELQPK